MLYLKVPSRQKGYLDVFRVQTTVKMQDPTGDVRLDMCKDEICSHKQTFLRIK